MRTFILITALTALFLGVGYFFAGTTGMLIGLVVAFITNFLAYWYSDRIVLTMYRAKPLSDAKIKEMVSRLAAKAGLPEPKLYIADLPVPNAFATGRCPAKAAICVTRGLLDLLKKDEIEGVLAHEMSHIKHRDTLIQTMSATIAGAITWLGYLFWFGDSRNRSIFSYLLLFFLVPIAATLIRMAISRDREFRADKTGAHLSSPFSLASALEKISSIAKKNPIRGNASTSSMFIVNPFSLSGLEALFSTHPPTEERVRRLRGML